MLALREAKGFTQDPYVSMPENGKRKAPSLPALQRFAKALGVPVTELLE
jgi:transcriptional regulator with XRE-family HTH domain